MPSLEVDVRATTWRARLSGSGANARVTGDREIKRAAEIDVIWCGAWIAGARPPRIWVRR